MKFDICTPSFWQQRQWKIFREACGEKSFFITTKNANALVIEKSPHFLKFWKKKIWEIQRGPFGESTEFFELCTKVFNLAKNKNIERVRVFPPLGQVNFWQENNLLSELTQKLKIKTSPAPEIFPEHTLFLDLTLSEEEILAQMKQKGRYNIKKSQREKDAGNIIIEEEKDIENFWKLLQETAKRDGFTTNKKKVYQAMFSTYSEKTSDASSKVLLLSAKTPAGEMLASKLFLVSGEMGIYYYGASSNRQRKLLAPYLLQWEGIKWTKSQGALRYDFLGLAPENEDTHQLASVSQFKTRFGGERIISARGIDFWI